MTVLASSNMVFIKKNRQVVENKLNSRFIITTKEYIHRVMQWDGRTVRIGQVWNDFDRCVFNTFGFHVCLQYSARLWSTDLMDTCFKGVPVLEPAVRSLPAGSPSINASPPEQGTLPTLNKSRKDWGDNCANSNECIRQARNTRCADCRHGTFKRLRARFPPDCWQTVFNRHHKISQEHLVAK